MARYRGRHRAPATFDLGSTGRVLARTALAGAVVGAPLAAAVPAFAASDATWDRVAQCESSGRWDINTGNGFSGGVQFTPSTWAAFGGHEFAPVAYQASRAQQIVVAERVLAGQGWNAWPVCSRKAGATGEGVTLRSGPAQPVRASGPVAPRPAAPQPSAPAATGGSYVVQRGDTLAGIALRHHVVGGWKALVMKNSALAANPNRIFPGQHITL